MFSSQQSTANRRGAGRCWIPETNSRETSWPAPEEGADRRRSEKIGAQAQQAHIQCAFAWNKSPLGSSDLPDEMEKQIARGVPNVFPAESWEVKAEPLPYGRGCKSKRADALRLQPLPYGRGSDGLNSRNTDVSVFT
jgi:hypothetical protein